MKIHSFGSLPSTLLASISDAKDSPNETCPFVQIAIKSNSNEEEDDQESTRVCALSSSSIDRAVHFFHVPSLQHTSFKLPNKPTCVAWSPTGNHVVVGDTFGSLHFANKYGKNMLLSLSFFVMFVALNLSLHLFFFIFTKACYCFHKKYLNQKWRMKMWQYDL
jgi:hypothetical protein